MRIVWFTSKLNFESAGGSVEEIDFILTKLLSLGHDVTAVTCYSKGNRITHTLAYPIIEEHCPTTRLLGTQKWICRKLRQYEGDADVFIVDGHLFMYGAGFYRLFGGKPIAAFVNQFLSCWEQYTSSLFPVPSITKYARLRKILRTRIEQLFLKLLANRLDIFAFVSPTLRRMYEDFGLRRSGADMVIGDPINIQELIRIAGVSEVPYQERRSGESPLTIFFSSRMTPGKGFDMLLKGFSFLKNKDDYRLVLGGSGPERQQIEQMIKDLCLEKYVTLTGWVSKERLYELYKEADIFVQADWWPAGTSISLIYAMAFGVPSVLPRGGGLQWNAGDSAAYFTYRDPQGLALAIESLDSQKRAMLSYNCYKRLNEPDMNYHALVSEFSARFERLLGASC